MTATVLPETPLAEPWLEDLDHVMKGKSRLVH